MTSETISIGKRIVGPSHPCYVIAELSCNHKQNYDDAVALVRAAADAGADAVKLQTYTADTLTINSRNPCFLVDSEDAPEVWQQTSLYDLYQKAFTPWEWHAPLQAVAKELAIDFFSTPFDETAVRFLEDLNVPCHKIASYEATYLQLLRAVAQTGKPVILSVGFATEPEIEAAVSALRDAGAREISLLHCVTTYSTNPDSSVFRLATIRELQRKFGIVPGFSDNNGGTDIPAKAVLAGACIVEKHLTLGKNDGSLDSTFSLDPKEFKAMVKGIREAENALGKVTFGTANDTEQQFRKYRRSIFVVKPIAAGQQFSSENVRVIRPASGLEPKHFERIIGLRASRDIAEGTPLIWDMIEEVK